MFFLDAYFAPLLSRDELESYMELTPDVRVIILKALCEARADVRF
jgi:hypothetical protein